MKGIHSEETKKNYGKIMANTGYVDIEQGVSAQK